jgi:hypothetical protein
MDRVKLVKAGDAWNVVAHGHLSSCADLELAAVKALSLAERYGASVELGEGVPKDALERGRRRRERSKLHDQDEGGKPKSGRRLR